MTKRVEEKKKLGRPSKFNQRLSELVCQLYEEGMTDQQVSDILHIGKTTLYYWRKANPDFLKSTRESKEIADQIVEASLFQRAIGYTHDEVKHASYEGRFTDEVTVKKHYPPDTKAIEFWLKNRKPDKWRDKQEIDLSNSDGTMRTVIILPDNKRDSNE